MEYLPLYTQKHSVVLLQKINTLDEQYTGLALQTPSGNISGKVVNIDEYFERYQNGWDLYSVLSRMSDQLEKNDYEVPLSFISEYKNIKDRLFVRISNCKNNESVLETVPHQNYVDLALTFHIAFGMQKESFTTLMITNEMMETYDISLDQLHSDALESSARFYPPNIIPLHTSPQSESLILSNDMQIFGASVLFYPGVIRKLAERMHGDYYIIPSYKR